MDMCLLSIPLLVPAFAIAFYFYRRWAAGGVCTSTVDLSGRIAIVTGSNTGIGIHTAETLAKMGAHVVLACRNPTLGQEAVDKIKKNLQQTEGTLHSKGTSTGNVEFLAPLDLSSLSSVQAFSEAFLRRHGNRLHLLVNNAGVMMIPERTLTKDGFEMQFGTNHLGHFALTLRLKEALLETAKNSPKGAVRVVNVSSLASEMPGATIDFNNLQFEKNYNLSLAYYQSKLANILFARELARRFREEKINASTFSLHPGGIVTELTRYLPGQFILNFAQKTGLIFLAPLKTPWQGAQTNIYCSIEPGLEEKSGEYFADCKVKKNRNKTAYDDEVAKKLWNISEELVGIKW